MESNSPVKLTSSLAKVLHHFCNGFVDFLTYAHLTGDLCLVTEEGLSVRFSVDEKVLRFDDNCVKIYSNSHNISTCEDDETLEPSSFNVSFKNPILQGPSSAENILVATHIPEINFLETDRNDVTSAENVYEGKSKNFFLEAEVFLSDKGGDNLFHSRVKRELSDIKLSDLKTLSDMCNMATEIHDKPIDSLHGELNGKEVFTNKCHCPLAFS